MNSLNYSVLKYGVNTKAAGAKFNALTKTQLFRYEWLSDKFTTHQDLLYCTIGCLFDDVSVQFGGKQEVLDAFYKMKSRRESLTYTLKSDKSKHELLGNFSIQKLFLNYIGGECSPEYVILRDHENTTSELFELYENPQYAWAHSKIIKLIKYKDFIPVAKYLPTIQNTYEELA
jgi:hypothetical protein